MSEQHEIFKAQRAKFEEKARGLKSYIQSLKETAAKHGTDEAVFSDDLTRATSDLDFYECQAGECAAALNDDPAARRTFQVYQDAAGEWRWRLVAGNGRIVADSGEGYQHKQDCLHGIELVRASAEAQIEGAD
ncbi:MAG TPA: DUF1508 domain-containing protein [Pyrinomonadaceae bacterium]|jgi:hypothetical protein